MIPIKLHTENFEGEAKKVGDVVIGNETIPVFEFSVKVVEKKREVVFDYDGFKSFLAKTGLLYKVDFYYNYNWNFIKISHSILCSRDRRSLLGNLCIEVHG